MNSEERMLCVLQRQQPDRVPHFEWLVDRRVRDALLPGCKSHNEFAVKIGQDAVIVDPIFKRKKSVPTAGVVSGATLHRIHLKSMA